MLIGFFILGFVFLSFSVLSIFIGIRHLKVFTERFSPWSKWFRFVPLTLVGTYCASFFFLTIAISAFGTGFKSILIDWQFLIIIGLIVALIGFIHDLICWLKS